MDSGASYAVYTLEAGLGWIWWVIGGAALLVVGGVAVYVFVIKGRADGEYDGTEEDEEEDESEE